MIRRDEMKQQAKQMIGSGRVSPILASLIVVLVTNLFDNISLMLEYDTNLFLEMQRAWELGADYVAPTPTKSLSLTATFLSILMVLLTTLLYAGYNSFCMSIRSGQRTELSSLLDGLGIAGKVIWCDIWVSLRIILWSMLFVLPGVVAFYRYRFAMYNIIRDPSLSVGEAIALSSRQTEGMKMDLFLLDMSFLGWNLLAVLSSGLANIWVLPYTTMTILGYYEEAMRRTPSQSTSENKFNL